MNGDADKCTKGIILAGGSGSRLHPLTTAVNKHLLPIFDKPMIYYPLTTLMLSGIREILLITSPGEIESFRGLLGDGSQWGIGIEYAAQEKPDGLPQAFIIGEEFIGGDPVALVLGDNIFYGHDLAEILGQGFEGHHDAAIFSYRVSNPQRYGVLAYDDAGEVVDIEEKPERPRSRDAVTGLYFYNSEVVEFARGLERSARGEYEITDLNRAYLRERSLKVVSLGRGTVWFDAGTPESMAQAAGFVELLQTRSGTGIAYPEEVAWRMGYIDKSRFVDLAGALRHCAYGGYLGELAEEA